MHKTKIIESQLYDESYDNKEHKSNKLISPLLDLGGKASALDHPTPEETDHPWPGISACY